MFRPIFTSLLLVLSLTGAARAGDGALGVWLTEVDRKGLQSHIRIRACGAKLCGRIVAAFDAAGAKVVTANIGKELFWDLEPQGGGLYENGRVWLPLVNLRGAASMWFVGAKLKVRACKGPVCATQIWTRVR